MNMWKRYLFGIICASAFCGCSHFTPFPKDVEDAIDMAGNNWEELFGVMQHYRESGDTAKLRAAEFIIGNMKDKRYYEGETVDRYHEFMDSLFAIKQDAYDIGSLAKQFLVSNGGKSGMEGVEVRRDVETLRKNEIIDNIEHAFKVWQAPWNKTLDLDEFCEFILPYRTGTEKPEEWRKRYAEEFGRILFKDSVYTSADACMAVNAYLIDKGIKIIPGAISSIDLMPCSLLRMNFGKCNDCARLAVYAMRSVGVPVSMCSIPHWGTKGNGHTFNVLRGEDGRLYDFLGTEAQPGHHLEMFHDSVPKVYMMTYGKQKASLAVVGKGEDIPRFFKNPYLMDITEKMEAINTANVTIPFTASGRFGYLCVFDINGWVPVAWGEVKNGSAVFNNVGTGVVYQAATFADDKLQCHGFPFLVESNGFIRYFKPQKNTFAYVLERKNPESNSWEGVPKQVIGGVFQGANQKDFRDAITYYKIENEPPLKYVTVKTDSGHPVKYLRYLSSANTYGNMGEVEFYTQNGAFPLQGKVYGNFRPSKYFPTNGAEKLFDGDPLTFFHTSDSLCWGAIELERPVSISRIRFIIRNDDNGIRKGHEYELFYASDSCWKSLGRKTAVADDEIRYENLPKNALFWLRDYTKGHEERIFEINSSGTVVWH